MNIKDFIGLTFKSALINTDDGGNNTILFITVNDEQHILAPDHVAGIYDIIGDPNSIIGKPITSAFMDKDGCLFDLKTETGSVTFIWY